MPLKLPFSVIRLIFLCNNKFDISLRVTNDFFHPFRGWIISICCFLFGMLIVRKFETLVNIFFCVDNYTHFLSNYWSDLTLQVSKENKKILFFDPKFLCFDPFIRNLKVWKSQKKLSILLNLDIQILFLSNHRCDSFQKTSKQNFTLGFGETTGNCFKLIHALESWTTQTSKKVLFFYFVSEINCFFSFFRFSLKAVWFFLFRFN